MKDGELYLVEIANDVWLKGKYESKNDFGVACFIFEDGGWIQPHEACNIKPWPMKKMKKFRVKGSGEYEERRAA